MATATQSFPQGTHLGIDSPAKPAIHRVRQILNQVPLSIRRRGNPRLCDLPHNQQANKPQQRLLGASLEFPIHDIEPLQTLNAYRRDLGLKPTKNLISSAIYDYNPTAIANIYDRLSRDHFSASSSVGSLSQPQLDDGPLKFARPVARSSFSDRSSIDSLASTQREGPNDVGSDTQSSATH
ncbi:hypothetical protein SAMD00023353_0302140 [Rosellinia necatrix]|uniref:Uncharacterized protein n=1 Tax=Rosellinia necatrix TaxID=77044 RepID=A0A1W2TDK8_ROSNE|nr:hypothetical protein SAMD00023353_0302140 [Rosellinia necatrix]